MHVNILQNKFTESTSILLSRVYLVGILLSRVYEGLDSCVHLCNITSLRTLGCNKSQRRSKEGSDIAPYANSSTNNIPSQRIAFIGETLSALFYMLSQTNDILSELGRQITAAL